MKITCHCGGVIVDQSDDLPHKAHLIPDQEWFATLDALDTEVIDRLAAGQITSDAAYRTTREILSRAMRSIWQCHQCGRLYADVPHGQPHCYRPENSATSHGILRTD